MESFIKKLFLGNFDKQVHKQFIRFSRGEFKGRAALNVQKTDKIKLKGSFEFSVDFSLFVAENSDSKFSGIILSKEKIEDLSGKEKNGIWQYEVENVSSEKIRNMANAYALLLDAYGEGITLKTKKKLPKPGKSGEIKIDDGFCVIEADMRYWNNMRDAFMLPDCKKCKISHTYIIEEVIVDKNEKDFAKMRENAKKKGRVIKNMIIDGLERKEDKEFIA